MLRSGTLPVSLAPQNLQGQILKFCETRIYQFQFTIVGTLRTPAGTCTALENGWGGLLYKLKHCLSQTHTTRQAGPVQSGAAWVRIQTLELPSPLYVICPVRPSSSTSWMYTQLSITWRIFLNRFTASKRAWQPRPASDPVDRGLWRPKPWLIRTSRKVKAALICLCPHLQKCTRANTSKARPPCLSGGQRHFGAEIQVQHQLLKCVFFISVVPLSLFPLAGGFPLAILLQGAGDLDLQTNLTLLKQKSS